MTRLLASTDFAGRLVPRQRAEHPLDHFPTASSLTPEVASPAAEVSLRASAAFSHFTESGSQVAAGPDQPAEAGASVSAGTFQFTETCPDAPAQRERTGVDVQASSAGALTLSDHTLILLRAIANYEQCSNEHAVALALADYATKIGAGPLARAVLDERERLSGAGSDGIPDDLHNVPEFVRSDDVRFGGARKALRNDPRGLR